MIKTIKKVVVIILEERYFNVLIVTLNTKKCFKSLYRY